MADLEKAAHELDEHLRRVVRYAFAERHEHVKARLSGCLREPFETDFVENLAKRERERHRVRERVLSEIEVDDEVVRVVRRVFSIRKRMNGNATEIDDV